MALAVVAALGSSAQADILLLSSQKSVGGGLSVIQDGFGQIDGDATINTSVLVPQFDPALGVLNSVEVEVEFSGLYTTVVENLLPVETTSLDASTISTVTASYSYDLGNNQAIGSDSDTVNSGPFTISDPDESFQSASHSIGLSESETYVSNLSEFEGPGFFPVDVTLDFETLLDVDDFEGSASLAQALLTGAHVAEVTVTYDFEGVPEPSTLILLGVGVIGFLTCVGRRTKR